MVNTLPPAHFKFLCDLESILIMKNGDGTEYVCVHAGLNPLRDLTAQNDNDVFWIRDEFLANVHPFERLVVFGHTPHQDVFMHLPYKMGLDTGLVFGNKLSCVEVSSGKVMEVKRNTKEVVVSSVDMKK
jgi:serine/threonine protein phosphatase 1